MKVTVLATGGAAMVVVSFAVSCACRQCNNRNVKLKFRVRGMCINSSPSSAMIIMHFEVCCMCSYFDQMHVEKCICA